MIILAIESSCDETSAAVVETTASGLVTLLSQSTATSLTLHSKTGGIIPEVAAREQSKFIIPVIQDALKNAKSIEQRAKSKNDPKPYAQSPTPDIDAIAVTYGPGLIGSLLVGVETAKTLSYLWNKPLIPVNHLFGHIYANWLRAKGIEHRAQPNALSSTHYAELPEFPAIALIVSGGHTDLVLMKSHTDITWLGGTRDDAAGECFDKSGRLLGFAYPAGPEIEQHAKLGNPKTYHFPRPLKHDGSFDFSFSGLKTAVLREVQKLHQHPRGEEDLLPNPNTSGVRVNKESVILAKAGIQEKNWIPGQARDDKKLSEQQVNDLCRGLQDAIIDVLVGKTFQAAEKYNVKSILLSGGVAANQTLSEACKQYAISYMPYAKIFVPQKSLCTDNAAMIGAAAFFQGNEVNRNDVAANPELYFD